MRFYIQFPHCRNSSFRVEEMVCRLQLASTTLKAAGLHIQRPSWVCERESWFRLNTYLWLCSFYKKKEAIWHQVGCQIVPSRMSTNLCCCCSVAHEHGSWSCWQQTVQPSLRLLDIILHWTISRQESFCEPNMWPNVVNSLCNCVSYQAWMIIVRLWAKHVTKCCKLSVLVIWWLEW